MTTLIQGDCLEKMQDIPAGSVDMILTDPPYGTTACSWDTIIPLEPMWAQVKRVIKPNGAIALFGSEPFSSVLRMSNIKMYKYDWIWEKSRHSLFVHAKNRPLKAYENIVLFSFGAMGHDKKTVKRMEYYPQFGNGRPYTKFNKAVREKNNKTIFAQSPSHVSYTINNNGERYPRDVIKFANPNNDSVHPTQKPVKLLEYLIQTYTHESETVLDFTMGSGSTGVACVETNRDFIGIELDDKYFKIAQDRITKAQSEPRMFY